jgi:hypothetical protein
MDYKGFNILDDKKHFVKAVVDMPLLPLVQLSSKEESFQWTS